MLCLVSPVPHCLTVFFSFSLSYKESGRLWSDVKMSLHATCTHAWHVCLHFVLVCRSVRLIVLAHFIYMGVTLVVAVCFCIFLCYIKLVAGQSFCASAVSLGLTNFRISSQVCTQFSQMVWAKQKQADITGQLHAPCSTISATSVKLVLSYWATGKHW